MKKLVRSPGFKCLTSTKLHQRCNQMSHAVTVVRTNKLFTYFFTEDRKRPKRKLFVYSNTTPQVGIPFSPPTDLCYLAKKTVTVVKFYTYFVTAVKKEEKTKMKANAGSNTEPLVLSYVHILTTVKTENRPERKRTADSNTKTSDKSIFLLIN